MRIIEKLECLLEWGGIRKDVVLLVLSGIGVLCSLLKIQPFPFDMAWVAIVLCGLPIILEAVIGLVTAFDIKADVLVSLALIASICIGDQIRVLPGEGVPVDGVIVSGQTSINQAVMTGESLPVDKTVGDPVSSGTVNQFGAFLMEATKVGEDSSIQADDSPGGLSRASLRASPGQGRGSLLQEKRRCSGRAGAIPDGSRTGRGGAGRGEDHPCGQ